MIDTLARVDLRQNHRLFIESIWRNQNRDRLTDHLFGQISKQARRPAIPGLNDSLEVLADNRIVGSIDNGSQPVSSVRRVAGRNGAPVSGKLCKCRKFEA
jgi:hypothetical protein